MPGPAQEHLQALIQQGSQNLPLIEECLNRCLEIPCELQAPIEENQEDPALLFANAREGLVLEFQFSEGIFFGMLPSELLPRWWRQPTPTQESRLQTLPVEWSLLLFPEDWELQKSRTVVSDDVSEILQNHEGNSEAVCLLYPLTIEGQPGKFHLCGPWQPLEAAPVQQVRAESSAQSAIPPTAPVVQIRSEQQPLLRQFLKLPVTVVVRLAEKKIEVGQLLSLTPGALITFNKACEELLDLYVNNCLLCRGEAVKIGEKFGLKINQMVAPMKDPLERTKPKR